MTEEEQEVTKKDSLDTNDDIDTGSTVTALNLGVGVGTAAADPGVPKQVEEEDDGDDDTDTLSNDSNTTSEASEEDNNDKDKDKDKDKEKKGVRKQTRKKRNIQSTSPPKNSPFVRSGYWFLLHIICLAIYLIPILSVSEYNKGEPVLDELHITQESNKDVNGETTLRTIFTNDYWGRPMQSASSHRSWRPLTVLSFRYLKGGDWMSTLSAYRLFNVLTHAVTAELVGILATKLLLTAQNPDLLRLLTKLLWILHPTHVEVTANAANRPHLFAVMFAVLLADPDLPIPLFLLVLICGFLSSETFLFQVVPITVTMAAITYMRLYHGPQQLRRRGSVYHQLWNTMGTVRLRLFLTATSAAAYIGGRFYLDTLSIPTGLIRPAENPFYNLKGVDRVLSYAYVLAIHVAKSWDVDFIGFSHEYGHACIRPLTSWRDARLFIPAGMVAVLAVTALYLLWIRQRRRSVLSVAVVLFVVHLSWMATLFPIAGILKVGTFIADRIVVTSTVSVSIIVANAAAQWVMWRLKDRTQQGQKLWILGLVGLFMWRRVHNRTLEWMDSIPLIESSLRTCPEFAKGHLEMSKIYSGLYPERFDLKQSRWHLEQVERIDPDFCDVHAQFAHVAIQEQKYIEFEERLTQALLCPFSLNNSLDLWQRYWKMAQDGTKNSPDVVEAAAIRYEKHMEEIRYHLAKEELKEEGKEKQKKSSSPLAGWDNREL